MSAAELLPQSPFVIRRETMGQKKEALGVIQRAEREAESMRLEAQRVVEQEIQRGYADGVRDGRAEAARLLAEAAATVDAFYEAREEELTDLAFAVAHRLIGELPPGEQMARIARSALSEHRSSVKIMLRAAPATASALHRALAGLDPDNRVQIEADEVAAPGSITLVHDRGRSSIGLLDQFRALIADVRGAK